MSTSALLITTTIDSQNGATELATALLDAKIAACVQIEGPLQSRYRWRGTVETATEWRCTIKTVQAHYAAVETTIRAIHHYETPEIIATQVFCGSDDYLAWIIETTSA